jgi:hypothetical protein
MSNREEFFGEYLSQLCCFEELVDRNGILEISLSTGSRKRFKLVFNTYLLFRKMNEGDAILTINDMSRDSMLGKSLYFFEKSEILKWFLTESGGIYDAKDLSHCRILTVDDVIDVICLVKSSDSTDSVVALVAEQ